MLGLTILHTQRPRFFKELMVCIQRFGALEKKEMIHD